MTHTSIKSFINILIISLLYILTNVFCKKFNYHKLSVCYKPVENKFAKYVASLRVGGENDNTYGSKHFCSGAIISTKYILTAGHCLQNLLNDNKRNGKFYMEAVIGNQHRLVPTKQTEIIQIKDIFIHPNYSNNNYKNDIALVELNQQMQLKMGSREILSLATQHAKENMSCISVNWHEIYQNGPLNDELFHTDILLTNFELCNNFYESTFHATPYTIICGKNLLHKSCNHDNYGALLICNDQLFGISRPSIKPCNPDVGITFTNIFLYTNWLTQMHGNDALITSYNFFIIGFEMLIIKMA